MQQSWQIRLIGEFLHELTSMLENLKGFDGK